MNMVLSKAKNYLNLVLTKTKNSFKFNVFEITISGILLAIFLITIAFLKLSIGRVINLSTDIPFYIVFGILLGIVKGSILAIIADTISLMFLSPSGLAFWMIEYAIIPPCISIISSILFHFYVKNKLKTSLILSSFLYMVLIINIIILITNQNKIYKSDNSDKFPRLFILYLTVGFSLLISFFVSYLIAYYFITKKLNETILKYLFMFSIVAFIIVLFRWLYGPYVFIVYWNRFMANTTSSNGKILLAKDYSLFAFYASKIILKSMIEIPFFTLIMIPISSVLLIIKEKTYNNIYRNQW